jgi:hypothetical protein
MYLYSLISNYETSNKYTKHLNICAHLFNMVATIIRVRGLIILSVVLGESHWVSAFRFIWSRWRPFQIGATPHPRTDTLAMGINYVSIARHYYEHNSNGQCWCHHCSSLLYSLIATGVADVSFHPSLLISQTVDIKVVYCYYDAGSL